MVSMYQPKNLHNSDVWPRKFWGSKLTASSVISSMAGRSTHCGIFQDMELMTWGLQGDAVCSHYQSGAMPGRLDGIGLGRPWPGTSIFCFFSGISDGFEDYSCDIIVHPTNILTTISKNQAGFKSC